MNSYACPLNNRVCRCDPNAPDEKFHPCQRAKRIGTLVRLLGSNFEGEAISAATGLRRLLPSEGLVFNDLAVLIENCGGAIEEKKYSDADIEHVWRRGVDKGRSEEACKQQAPPEFYDADGYPQWNAMALFCQKNPNRLNEWEREFIDSMAGKTTWREPTEKERKHLLAVFVKLGGYYDPKTVHLHR